MHRLSSIVAVALAGVLAASAISASSIAAPPSPPRVGQQAPDFRLVDQNGKTVTLSAARGHKVVLVFYRGYW